MALRRSVFCVCPMNEEIEVLKVVCQALEKHEIAYMITGSIASSFYTVPRMTRDIDIVVEIRQENAEKLVDIFQKDFYVDIEAVRVAIQTHGMFNIIHNQQVIKVDLIVRKDDPYRKLEFDRRQQVEMDGTVVWIVSPEDLILSKLFWAKDTFSEMQLTDVRNLLRTTKDLDKSYLQKWVSALGLKAVYEKATP